MTNKIETVAVFGASRLGNDPAFATEMFEIGRLLALEGKTVCVGGLTGLTEQAVLGALSVGGKVKVFLIPEEQASSIAKLEEYGLNNEENYVPVDRDNARTLALLRSDAWLSGPGGDGTISEGTRGKGWNYNRRIRGRDRTPHFMLNMGQANKGLIAAYRGAVQDGLADASALEDLIVCNSAADIIEKMRGFEARGMDAALTSPPPRPAGQLSSRPAPRA